MAPYLLIIDEAGSNRFELESERIAIGRSSECDLRIDDRSLSRHHAVLTHEGEQWLVEDLGSRNRTLVNGDPAREKRALEDGDQLQLGKIVLVFKDPGAFVRFRDDSTERSASDKTLVIRSDKLLSSATDLFKEPHHNLMQVISQTTAMLIADSGTDQFYDRVLTGACNVVKGERGALLSYDSKTKKLEVKATRKGRGEDSLFLSKSIMDSVVQEHSSVLTRDALRDPRFDDSKSVILQGIRSAMCVPLLHEEDVLGLMYVDRHVSEEAFSEQDLTVLTVLANLAAAKIHNLFLVEESLAKKRLEEEIRLAGEIQRSLLPQEDPKLEGYDIVGMTQPSRTVGGDVYDFFVRPAGLGFLVGDVSGKGVSASLLMAALQANLRAFLKVETDLRIVFNRVNDALFESTAPNKFATLFYGEIDADTGKGRYVSAGHTVTLLVRSGGTIERLEERNIILGAFPGREFDALGTFRLDSGDFLFLYSDGVTEMENEEEELFGEERLERLLAGCTGESASGIRDRVLDALTAFRGATPPFDDTSFIIVKRL